MRDTIAAIATPPGRGGVGIVRISGDRCRDICAALIGSVPKPREVRFAAFKDEQENIIDQGLCLYFAAPKSFTGEDVLELQAHGGPIIMDLLLQRVLQLGARHAEAGEFSKRAFLNDKIDLLQAEAISDLISASSEQAARAAMRSLQGDFSVAINNVVEKLIALRIYVEAALDFPDEEIDFLADERVMQRLIDVKQTLIQILAQAQQGALLNEGVELVIVGRPNAGKSTLLNSLAAKDIAIVTPIAGTTRDVVRTQINLDGVLLNVVDTAGLRITDDLVESEGIKRALAAAQVADLVLIMIDSLAQEQEIDLLTNYPEVMAQMRPGCKVLVVRNKIDQLGEQPRVQQINGNNVVSISAHTRAGVDLLRSEIKSVLGMTASVGEGIFVARRRHLDALQRGLKHVQIAESNLRENLGGELVAAELDFAQQVLGEITGKISADDLLGRIFSQFCIGK